MDDIFHFTNIPKNNIMTKDNYVKPEIEIIEISVEQGFATSAIPAGWGNGNF